MIKTDSKIVLVDGSEIQLPMSEEMTKQVFSIYVEVRSVQRTGASQTSYTYGKTKKVLHATAEQLGIAGLESPQVKDIPKYSVEDNIVEFLAELGVRFED